jgi:hypothetical protein
MGGPDLGVLAACSGPLYVENESRVRKRFHEVTRQGSHIHRHENTEALMISTVQFASKTLLSNFLRETYM